MDDSQPIIIKKIKKGGHGHHGGSWKVAYADFVTAMMAFFLLMWLLTAATPDQRLAIAGYFENPAGVTGSGGHSTSIINMGSTVELQNVGLGKAPTPNFKSEEEVRKRAEQIEADRLANLESILQQRIDENEAMHPYKDQVMIDITDEGLRVQIVDKENRPMFDLGSAVLKPYMVGLLREIAKVINKVPNMISLAGHTDAKQYTNNRGYTNWELSADRANASRRELVAGGIDSGKIARVEGLAETVPLLADDPLNPANRRISILVLKRTVDQTIAAEGEEIKEMLEAETKSAPVSLDDKIIEPVIVMPQGNTKKVPLKKILQLRKKELPPPSEPGDEERHNGIAPIQLEVNPIQIEVPPLQIEPVVTSPKSK